MKTERAEFYSKPENRKVERNGQMYLATYNSTTGDVSYDRTEREKDRKGREVVNMKTDVSRADGSARNSRVRHNKLSNGEYDVTRRTREVDPKGKTKSREVATDSVRSEGGLPKDGQCATGRTVRKRTLKTSDAKGRPTYRSSETNTLGDNGQIQNKRRSASTTYNKAGQPLHAEEWSGKSHGKVGEPPTAWDSQRIVTDNQYNDRGRLTRSTTNATTTAGTRDAEGITDETVRNEKSDLYDGGRPVVGKDGKPLVPPKLTIDVTNTLTEPKGGMDKDHKGVTTTKLHGEGTPGKIAWDDLTTKIRQNGGDDDYHEEEYKQRVDSTGKPIEGTQEETRNHTEQEWHEDARDFVRNNVGRLAIGAAVVVAAVGTVATGGLGAPVLGAALLGASAVYGAGAAAEGHALLSGRSDASPGNVAWNVAGAIPFAGKAATFLRGSVVVRGLNGARAGGAGLAGRGANGARGAAGATGTRGAAGATAARGGTRGARGAAGATAAGGTRGAAGARTTSGAGRSSATGGARPAGNGARRGGGSSAPAPREVTRGPFKGSRNWARNHPKATAGAGLAAVGLGAWAEDKAAKAERTAKVQQYTAHGAAVTNGHASGPETHYTARPAGYRTDNAAGVYVNEENRAIDPTTGLELALRYDPDTQVFYDPATGGAVGLDGKPLTGVYDARTNNLTAPPVTQQPAYAAPASAPAPAAPAQYAAAPAQSSAGPAAPSAPAPSAPASSAAAPSAAPAQSSGTSAPAAAPSASSTEESVPMLDDPDAAPAVPATSVPPAALPTGPAATTVPQTVTYGQDAYGQPVAYYQQPLFLQDGTFAYGAPAAWSQYFPAAYSTAGGNAWYSYAANAAPAQAAAPVPAVQGQQQADSSAGLIGWSLA